MVFHTCHHCMSGIEAGGPGVWKQTWVHSETLYLIITPKKGSQKATCMRSIIIIIQTNIYNNRADTSHPKEVKGKKCNVVNHRNMWLKPQYVTATCIYFNTTKVVILDHWLERTTAGTRQGKCEMVQPILKTTPQKGKWAPVFMIKQSHSRQSLPKRNWSTN